MASELLLGLAVQRGLLRYLLEWVEMALECSQGGGKINSLEFQNILKQMRTVTNGSAQAELPVSVSQTIPLYEAAILLLEEVSTITVTSWYCNTI